MPFTITCPHCNKKLNIREEHANKELRCPGCKEVFKSPPPPDQALDVVAVESPAGIVPSPSPSRLSRPAQAPARRTDDEDYDDEPRRQVRRRDEEERGKYADCPQCGNPGFADPVGFTWWGGLIGPRILSHVKCRECRTAYNGKSGKSNTTGIIIYTVVVLGIALGLVACFAVAGLISQH